MISTRGRYLVRIMVDLARNGGGDYTPLKEIARRQGISRKYLEQLLPLLAKASIVAAAPGKGGGYKLLRDPRSCTVREILELSERKIAPVACLQNLDCPRRDKCATLPMWRMYGELGAAFFGAVTIADLAFGDLEDCGARQAIELLQARSASGGSLAEGETPTH